MDRVRRSLLKAVAAHRRAHILDLAEPLGRAADMLSDRLRAGGKVLVCGNGGSAAMASHFAAELVGRFRKERRGLPAIALSADTAALTAIGNDYGFEQVFARQVEALWSTSLDVLLMLTTSGDSSNLVSAYWAAKRNQMNCVALTGRDGGLLAQALSHYPDDIEIRVLSRDTACIQEAQLMLLHCLCEQIEAKA